MGTIDEMIQQAEALLEAATENLKKARGGDRAAFAMATMQISRANDLLDEAYELSDDNGGAA